MPFCRKCGTSIAPDAAFCEGCGTPVFKTKTPLPVVPPPLPPASGDIDRGDVARNVSADTTDTDADAPTMVRNIPSYGAVNLEDLPVGHVIDDRYEVKVKLGQGGFGAVYRAYDREMRVDKALKIIPDLMFGDRMAMENLRNEASVMVKLNHHNIVRVYDLHTTGPIKYIDMEFVDGKSLTEILLDSPGRRVPEKDVRGYALQIAEGIGYAHSLNVIHRDIKPQNILLDKDGGIKVMDFGIAETVRSSISRISNRPATGTLVYMSPEQLLGENVGRESDIYSFGILLYELLNGKPPFYQGDIQYQILKKNPISLIGVSEQTNRLVIACLAKDKSERPVSFSNVKDMLSRVEVKKKTADKKPVPVKGQNILPKQLPAQRKQPNNRMSFDWLVGIAVVVVIAFVLIGIMVKNNRNSSTFSGGGVKNQSNMEQAVNQNWKTPAPPERNQKIDEENKFENEKSAFGRFEYIQVGDGCKIVFHSNKGITTKVFADSYCSKERDWRGIRRVMSVKGGNMPMTSGCGEEFHVFGYLSAGGGNMCEGYTYCFVVISAENVWAIPGSTSCETLKNVSVQQGINDCTFLVEMEPDFTNNGRTYFVKKGTIRVHERKKALDTTVTLHLKGRYSTGCHASNFKPTISGENDYIILENTGNCDLSTLAENDIVSAILDINKYDNGSQEATCVEISKENK